MYREKGTLQMGFHKIFALLALLLNAFAWNYGKLPWNYEPSNAATFSGVSCGFCMPTARPRFAGLPCVDRCWRDSLPHIATVRLRTNKDSFFCRWHVNHWVRAIVATLLIHTCNCKVKWTWNYFNNSNMQMNEAYWLYEKKTTTLETAKKQINERKLFCIQVSNTGSSNMFRGSWASDAHQP